MTTSIGYGFRWFATDTYEIQSVRWVAWCSHGGRIGYVDWRTPDWHPVIAAVAKEETP